MALLLLSATTASDTILDSNSANIIYAEIHKEGARERTEKGGGGKAGRENTEREKKGREMTGQREAMNSQLLQITGKKTRTAANMMLAIGW
jgi:hypothetical protein